MQFFERMLPGLAAIAVLAVFQTLPGGLEPQAPEFESAPRYSNSGIKSPHGDGCGSAAGMHGGECRSPRMIVLTEYLPRLPKALAVEQFKEGAFAFAPTFSKAERLAKYRVTLGEDEGGMRQTLDFDAADDARALRRFKSLKRGDWGVLLKDGQSLAIRGDAPDDIIRPADPNWRDLLMQKFGWNTIP